MDSSRSSALQASPIVLLGLVVLAVLVPVWWTRLAYPFDLEWMEGGMLAHAWRLQQGLPLYTVDADWAPFIYPPGYSAVVAALGTPFGLSPTVGRAVSLLSVLAASGALAFRLHREGTGPDIAFGAAVAFLGTYQASGAFFDLVRPDSLGMALLAWSIALGLEERRGAPVAAGLLLAAAFTVKHNLAAFGLPMVIGLAFRSPRAALSFALASIGPALGLVALWQWQSEGMFLRFLVEVPQSHPLFWRQGLISAPREWGNAQPIELLVCAAALIALALRQRTLPTWLTATAPVWLGMAAAWWLTYEPPPPGLRNVPAGFAGWAVASSLVAVGIWWVGSAVDRARGLGALPSWRAVYGVGIGALAVGLASLMRAHSGGFLNVNIPLYWCVALGAGVALGRARQASEAPAVRWAVVVALCLDLGWSAARIDAAALEPTQADLDAGQRLVRALERESGPTLSPVASWLPVYAGKPPSLHAMAIFDLDWEGGPLQDELYALDLGFREERWGAILSGPGPFRDAIDRTYDEGVVLIRPDDPALWPQSGWRARPTRLRHPQGQ